MEYIFTNLPQYIRVTSRTEFSSSVVHSGSVLLFSEDGASLTAKLPDGSFITVGGSGGTDVSDTTAEAANVQSGYYFYDSAGVKTEGTLTVSGGVDVSDTTATAAMVLSGAVFHDSTGAVTTGTIPTVTAAIESGAVVIPSGYIASAQSFPVSSGIDVSATTAEASDVLSGKIFYNSGGIQTTGTIPTVTASVSGGSVIVPSGYIATSQSFPVSSGGGSATDFYRCAATVSSGGTTWSGYLAVLSGGSYSYASSATSGLSCGSGYLPQAGKVYADGALVRATLYQGNQIVDSNTVYAVQATRGMIELVTGNSLTNSGGTEIVDDAFDFSASSSVLDFPVTSAAKWLLNDFTVEIVFTPCSPSHPYPSMIATGDAWENNSLSMRFGNNYTQTVGLFWNDVGDPVMADGSIAYSNSEFKHAAFCRSSDTITLYINGIAIATEYCDTQWDVASDNLIRLGALDIPDAKYNGKIRWARISNIARYSSNFDPTDLINLI